MTFQRLPSLEWWLCWNTKFAQISQIIWRIAERHEFVHPSWQAHHCAQMGEGSDAVFSMVVTVARPANATKWSTINSSVKHAIIYGYASGVGVVENMVDFVFVVREDVDSKWMFKPSQLSNCFLMAFIFLKLPIYTDLHVDVFYGFISFGSYNWKNGGEKFLGHDGVCFNNSQYGLIVSRHCSTYH